jgi:hypothetical protein
MNKRFASFLLTGKVAALPLFAQESYGAIQDISTKDSPHYKSHKSLDAESLPSRNTVSVKGYDIQLLSDASPQNFIPKIMNLVLAGLHDRDELLIVISPEKDLKNFLKMDPVLLADTSGLGIWNHFSVVAAYPGPKMKSAVNSKKQSSDSRKSIRPISLPVTLPSFSRTTDEGSKIYIHILVAQNSKWDKSVFRYVDVLQLKSIDKSMLLSQYTEDCTVYSCPSEM